MGFQEVGLDMEDLSEDFTVAALEASHMVVGSGAIDHSSEKRETRRFLWKKRAKSKTSLFLH